MATTNRGLVNKKTAAIQQRGGQRLNSQGGGKLRFRSLIARDRLLVLLMSFTLAFEIYIYMCVCVRVGVCILSAVRCFDFLHHHM